MGRISQKQIFLAACALWIVGLMWSRFAISLGMITMLIAGLWGGNLKDKWKNFISNKYYLSVTAIFFIFLVSGLWSDNVDYFLYRMRIRLPFLFLPFAVCSIRGIDRETMHKVFYIFIGVSISGVLWSLSKFLLDVNQYVDSYSKGQILPTPIQHIRFSIMMSLSVGMSMYLLLSKVKFRQKYFLLGTIIFLSIYIHILAVRSGLLTLYILYAYTLFYFLITKVNKKIVLGLLFIFIAGIFFAVNYIPTVKKKIGYTLYSIELFQKNENIRELSDSRRLGSIAAGIHLGKENLLTGIGYGDLMDETNNYLKGKYPELIDLELLPHNQYVLAFTVIGIFGLILFTLFTIIPLGFHQGYKDFFFTSSQLMMWSSFMVEHTIESQIGTALYLVIIMIAMKNMEVGKS